MIIGVDTLGNIYLSLTQSNSNSQVMDMFFRYLDQKLEKERKNWKKNTVIILDNAPYHNSSATLKTFESLKSLSCSRVLTHTMHHHVSSSSLNSNKLI